MLPLCFKLFLLSFSYLSTAYARTLKQASGSSGTAFHIN